MKILILGNGFIGKAIIQRLESEGHEILIYSRSVLQDIQSKQILGDIFDGETFRKSLSWGPQVIIQSAWITTHGRYMDDPLNSLYSQFTSNLAKQITNLGVEHLIVLGTCAEYGPQSHPSTAGFTKVNPATLYAKEKVAAFESLSESLLLSGARLSWARVFQPYGPGQDKKRLLPYLIDSLRKGEQIKLSHTSSILDWITTRDIASAVSWIINNDTPIEVDIGTTVGFTNVELLRHLEELLGDSSQWLQLVQDSPSFNAVTVVGKDSPLFRSGWLPRDSLEVGLKWVLEE